MEATYDAVIVGGGIAGSALAGELAKQGISALVLERQTTYKDKIRGETIAPWGVREVVRLGLADVLLDAGGQYATTFVPYDEIRSAEEAEMSPLALASVAPDVAGQLNVGHPEACEALTQHAENSGAEVVRGVSEVRITAGSKPSVWWTNGDGPHEVSCRIVVGADGRGSSIRRQLGIGLEEREPLTFAAGLLVRSDADVEGTNVMGTEDDVLYLSFPRQDQLTRLYLIVDIARQREFTGAGRAAAFRDGFRKPSFPASDALAAGEAAGPCGGAPMTDAWTVGPPVAAGVVLAGDAAGWNDPIIGQGLSIALRDARSIGEVMSTSKDWSMSAFGGYVAERAERMRRLAIVARITTAMRCTFTDEGQERRRRWSAELFSDPIVLMQGVSGLAGPEAAPAEAFTDQAIERTLAL
ncbi:MAG: FAD-dependent oxidoreductase [Acidimicrobiales bacterium]